jgi:hypothetical protein
LPDNAVTLREIADDYEKWHKELEVKCSLYILRCYLNNSVDRPKNLGQNNDFILKKSKGEFNLRAVM